MAKITKVLINGVETSKVQINGGIWFEKSGSSGGEDIDYSMHLEALRENIYNYQIGDFATFWNKYYNEYVPNAAAILGTQVWAEIQTHSENITTFNSDPIYQECLNNGTYLDQTQQISILITSLQDDLNTIIEDFNTHEEWGQSPYTV